eukprot:scaffold1335_cov102-Isochrysis_galbana.AAC.8
MFAQGDLTPPLRRQDSCQHLRRRAAAAARVYKVTYTHHHAGRRDATHGAVRSTTDPPYHAARLWRRLWV